MNQFRNQLTHRFRQQQQFSQAYSPLYAALFGTVADWLSNLTQDPVVDWLLETARNRAPFDIPNLLAAGLHYEVLSRSEGVSALLRFYPTAGGDASPIVLYEEDEQGPRVVSEQFTSALRDSILARKNSLASFFQSNSVQTNETGRGISWLLPLCLTRWKWVHLLDLGASAGLNLIADQRSFQIDDLSGWPSKLRLGHAKQGQFVVKTSGGPQELFSAMCPNPQIISRTGCDLHPFFLESADAERKMVSFIWADQAQRVKRLREGIATFGRVQRSEVPVRLLRISLPEELPAFLDLRQSNSREPILIYNTYIKMYLPGKGVKLRDVISKWAVRQENPVLWIQWEPPSTILLQNAKNPQLGWLAWTADLWQNDEHHHFQLGWVHPHGQQVQWLAGLDAWISMWS